VSRRPTEAYVGALPAIAIVPWFFAGSLFPISTLPGALTVIAKLLPLTHALALIRYAFLDHRGSGLHDIWNMSNIGEMAWLSLAVVALFAVLTTLASVVVFKRSAVS
jgi:ABC-type polysaccharide/polyol phosphate export permease